MHEPYTYAYLSVIKDVSPVPFLVTSKGSILTSIVSSMSLTVKSSDGDSTVKSRDGDSTVLSRDGDSNAVSDNNEVSRIVSCTV